MIENIMKLQFFADAGTVVNATTGYVNAYNGDDRTEFAPESTLDPTLKAFYDTELLENARVELFYAQFAKRQPLPKNHKGSVEWRKWNTLERAKMLQEGVIPNGQKMSIISLTGSIDQYGTYVSITDKLELRAYDDVILGASEEMGASAAETQEALIRDALLAGTNVLYCDNINPNTILKKGRVPRINGRYYAVIHPSVAHDLRSSPEWIEAHKYSAAEEIFNGEIGELHGVRFIENTFAPVLGGEDYKNKAGTMTYASYFFGKDSFGIIDPEGGALEMIIHDKGEIGGPLNQFSTIGYKFETNGATILYPERVLRVMSCSSFSDTDEESK